MTLSRRDFLKIGGASCLVAGAGALAGCSPAGEQKATEPVSAGADTGEGLAGYAPVNFTEETEILIIGTGYAGLGAAMAPSSRQIKRAAHRAAKKVNQAVDHLADSLEM